jgi:UDP-N-acetylmuramoylalanine--D-glutamate ligase
MAYDFNGKKVAVIGMARSGLAAAEVLTLRGAEVVLYDSKPAEDLATALRNASELGVRAVTLATDIEAADIAIVSPGIRINAPIMDAIRHKKVSIWGEIEAAYRIADAPILAVTGTNGKTTTALLLAEMLRADGITTFAAGNIAAGSLAMPLISAAHKAMATNAIVAEISSFQLETIDTFKPRVASILNITSDHQDRQDWDSYVASKWRIFENQDANDTAVFRRDTPLPSTPITLQGNVIYLDQVAHPPWLNQIHLPGEHNKANTLAALGMAKAFGVDDNAIAQAALLFGGVVHRLEYVDTIDGVTYINNSMCTNNAAFSSSLSALPGRKIVLAGGVFKGGDMTPIADAVAENDVALLVLFGRSGQAIADTVRSQTTVRTAVVHDLSEAVEVGAEKASRGETVVLNPGCTSLDQFKDFEDRGDQFKSIVSTLRKVRSV